MSVRVRFAPSPTGYLHVGNIRAALLNWLFARKIDGGVFIVRIDDTDPERNREEYVDAIREDLEWLGLDWDENYRQSERMDLYAAAVEKLKAAGRLYACYETAEELDLKRKLQRAQGKPPVYDREGLSLTEAQKAALEAEGRTPHWRFRLDTDSRVEFEDLIRGHVSTDMCSLSDPILVRGDGSYLYTLPSVVDDMDMDITHVVRGEDHVTNSAVQIQIFEALGSKGPEFAHFSLLIGAKGEGLSKRTGSDLSVRALRNDAGIEAMALISLLGHLGTSDAVEPLPVVYPLIEGFQFSKFGKHATHIDPHELDVLNAKLLHTMSFEAVSERAVIAAIEGIDEAFWLAVRPNLQHLGEVKDWWRIVHGPVEPVIDDAAFAAEALALFPEGEVTGDTWRTWTAAVKEKTGAKGKALFMPLRQALTGQESGPELAVLLPLIGAERARSRLEGRAS